MSWTETTLPVVGKTVSRLGLAPNYGLASDDLLYAAERGFNLWIWSPIGNFGKVTPGLREVLRKDREKHVVVVLGGGYFPWMVNWGIERARKVLGIDTIDAYLLGWLGTTSALTQSVQDAVVAARDKGVVKAIGTSIHDRPRAGKLAEDSVLDLFMLRYNAAHPGAEREVFPSLARRNPGVIAYTATSWRQLVSTKLDDVPPWPGRDVGAAVPPLTAALCYRFQLQSPHVHVALTGPKDRAQLDENLRALSDGPLTPEEEAWIREYGRRVAKKKPMGAG